MRVRLKLKPGQRGTKKLMRRFGDRLVCVRYRYDAERRKRYKTVELIVSEAPWDPEPDSDAWVGVRVRYEETELRRRVKAAGGRWKRERRLWEVPYRAVRTLGLQERVAR